MRQAQVADCRRGNTGGSVEPVVPAAVTLHAGVMNAGRHSPRTATRRLSQSDAAPLNSACVSKPWMLDHTVNLCETLPGNVWQLIMRKLVAPSEAVMTV
ncbi:hypothetical protein E2C01_074320 [Portunus trituberculatus]|uniref:Uncharacterized protein n=1 Tax=Portunus trituberculatus TaxID=210409 RepID=A0A5B7IC32_PORTR|nr:hypothetical protein [Portunus trituberculatus]